MLFESLVQVYEEDHSLVRVLCDLSDWDPQTDPLEEFSVCFFSLPPKFKYFVKGKDQTFESHEKEHRKAYQNYLYEKRQELFNKLYIL